MSSATLLGAIHAVVDAPAGPLTVYNDEPPEGTDVVAGYAVIEDLKEEEVTLTFENGHEYRGTFSLAVWGEGAAAVEAKQAQFKALLEAEGVIQVAGRNTLACLMTDYRVELDRTRATDASRVTTCRASYLAWTTGP